MPLKNRHLTAVSSVELLMALSGHRLTGAMNSCVGTHQLAKAKRCYITESNENCQMDRKESELAYSIAMKSDGIFGGMA